MSCGIQAWAGESELTLIWESGTGDARLRGWERADGSRAIETNGDPVWEGDEGFAETWEARGYEPYHMRRQRMPNCPECLSPDCYSINCDERSEGYGADG